MYFCKSVVLQQYGTDIRDYAIVQLDRKATPRYHPMPVRFGRMPLSDRPVALLGAPLGMPLKIDDSGSVYQEDPAAAATSGSTTTGCHGDSGGPIIDLTTYQEVGMLTGSDLTPDLIWDDVRKCNRNSHDAGFLVGEYLDISLGDYCAGPGSANTRLCRGAPANDTPAGAEEIFPRYGQPQVLTGFSGRASSTFNSPCSASLGAPDVFFRFTLGQSTLLTPTPSRRSSTPSCISRATPAS